MLFLWYIDLPITFNMATPYSNQHKIACRFYKYKWRLLKCNYCTNRCFLGNKLSTISFVKTIQIPAVFAPLLWNMLPLEIETAKSVSFENLPYATSFYGHFTLILWEFIVFCTSNPRSGWIRAHHKSLLLLLLNSKSFLLNYILPINN